MLSSSNVVYHYECPGCMKSYIGKTESTLFNRTKEHGWSDKKSAIFKHFDQCSAWKEIVDLFEIDGEEIDPMQFQINSVRENTKIIRKSDNWLKLAFLESLAIKEHKPELNTGIRSCKELALFQLTDDVRRRMRRFDVRRTRRNPCSTILINGYPVLFYPVPR